MGKMRKYYRVKVEECTAEAIQIKDGQLIPSELINSLLMRRMIKQTTDGTGRWMWTKTNHPIPINDGDFIIEITPNNFDVKLSNIFLREGWREKEDEQV